MNKKVMAGPIAIYLLLSIFTFSGLAESEQNQEKTDTENKNIIDHNHHILSKKIIDIANGIDNLFYKNEGDSISPKNKSYILLENISTFKKEKYLDNNFRFRGKLNLPNTTRKIKLFFDTESENIGLNDKILGSKENNRNEDSNAGIEVNTKKIKNWRHRFRLGIHVNPKVDTYVKLIFKRKDDLGDIWDSRFQQDFKYSYQEGRSFNSALNFIRPINKFTRLQFSTNIYYRDEDEVFELAQIASILNKLSHTRSIRYQTGVLKSYNQLSRSTAYFLGLHYRKNIYRPWLFVSLQPEFFF